MGSYIYILLIVYFLIVKISHGLSAECSKVGPQAPRDLEKLEGNSRVNYSPALPSSEMNLCNIHFHANAEHKARGYSSLRGQKKHMGYICNESAKNKKIGIWNIDDDKKIKCDDLQVWDTVEIHWVFSSCDVKPGPGLESCLSDTCVNPQLRVQAGIFYLTNNEDAIDMISLDYNKQNLFFHQPKALPIYPKANIVEYLGSTTGSKYDGEKNCSPFQVTWSVPKTCMAMNIESLKEWCKSNIFNEDYAHGVRPIVDNLNFLDDID